MGFPLQKHSMPAQVLSALITTIASAGYPYNMIVSNGYNISSHYGEPNFVTYKWVNASGIAGLEITTVAPAPQVYSASIQITSDQTVHKGDTIAYQAEVKVIQPNATYGAGVQFIMEQASTYAGYQEIDVPMTNQSWQQVQFAMTSETDCSQATPCQYNTNVGMPFVGQTIAVRAIEVRNYGQGAGAPTPSDLPTIGFTYGGREPDAPWRTEAAARIEEHRKANMTVRVVDDATGKAVPGASVGVTMKGHYFRFGCFMYTGVYQHYGNTSTEYFRLFKDNFNHAVMEGGFDWGEWEQGQGSTVEKETFLLYEWLHRNLYLNANATRPSVRTHSLVWDSYRWLPQDIQALVRANKSSEALARADAHVLNETTVTRQLLAKFGARSLEWDVANEISVNDLIQDKSGDPVGTVGKWMRLAAQGDPEAGRGLNDDDVCSAVFGTGRRDFYREKLPAIQSAAGPGAPMTFFGLESHFEWGMPPISTAIECMMSLAPGSASGWPGLPLRVTEYDVVQNDLVLYGDHLRDYLTAAFSVPGVDSFLMWGMTDQFHWRHSGPLFSNPEPDVFVPKPGYAHWRDLVFRQWWTNATGAADSAGEFAVRGFLGDYALEAVDSQGRRAAATVSMYDKDLGAVVELRLQ